MTRGSQDVFWKLMTRGSQDVFWKLMTRASHDAFCFIKRVVIARFSFLDKDTCSTNRIKLTQFLDDSAISICRQVCVHISFQF